MFYRSAIITMLFVLGIPFMGHADSGPLFSKIYERSANKPASVIETFDVCNPEASYNLVVTNGEEGKDRISSASISLNGNVVIKQKELNQKVESLDKPVELLGDNTLTIKLASGPAGLLKVELFCTASCLDIEIISPLDGTTVSESEAIVRGEIYNSVGEAGVVLSSAHERAKVYGDNFADIVSLKEGDNTVIATVTDACGFKASDSITLSSQGEFSQVEVSASPTVGAPAILTGNLEVYLKAYPGIDNVASYSWDFDGDGNVDETNAWAGGISIRATNKYAEPGLYSPTLTVTDTEGNSYVGTTIVNIVSREEADAIFKAKWASMKAELSAGDVDGALEYFHKGSWKKYREIFGLLGDQLPALGIAMQEIDFLYFKGNTVKYRVRRDQLVDGEMVILTYYVYFAPNRDGIWKILSF